MGTPCIIPHSYQNLICLRSGADYSQFIDNDAAEELLTSLILVFQSVQVGTTCVVQYRYAR